MQSERLSKVFVYPSPFFKFWVSTEFAFSLFNAGFCEVYLFTSIYGIANIFNIILWIELLLLLFLFKKIEFFFPILRHFWQIQGAVILKRVLEYIIYIEVSADLKLTFDVSKIIPGSDSK